MESDILPPVVVTPSPCYGFPRKVLQVRKNFLERCVKAIPRDKLVSNQSRPFSMLHCLPLTCAGHR